MRHWRGRAATLIFTPRCHTGSRVRGEFLDLSGARIYYYAAGSRGAGNPVVFLHGFATSGHLWNDVVPLMPPGHRLVVLDLLGYGRSDRPGTRDLDIRSHAARVLELLDELRIDSACIVGHGLGGGIAQSLAVRHADRVSHLCLIDAVAFDHWPNLRLRIARALLPLTRLLPPRAVAAALRRALASGYTDAVRVARSIDVYVRPFSDEAGRDALIAHLRAMHSDETADLATRLSGITIPTAIIWGRHDNVMQLEVGRQLQAAIPGASLTIVDDARHFAPEETPRPIADVVAQLLRR
jgi:pimeloyl-ACP methyl ester carboxylesterase